MYAELKAPSSSASSKGTVVSSKGDSRARWDISNWFWLPSLLLSCFYLQAPPSRESTRASQPQTSTAYHPFLSPRPMLAQDAKREEDVPLSGGTQLQVFHFRRQLPEGLRETTLPELEFYGLLDRANTGAAMYPNKTLARKSLRWAFVASVLLSTCACPRPDPNTLSPHPPPLRASIHTHHPRHRH